VYDLATGIGARRFASACVRADRIGGRCVNGGSMRRVAVTCVSVLVIVVFRLRHADLHGESGKATMPAASPGSRRPRTMMRAVRPFGNECCGRPRPSAAFCGHTG